ncbi:MAG: hypothetical protein COB02_02740 [Candidatus Cloacimonadota bacterium]|nr:MAG: hypothetical protein COB02_02740 [Candidatus Cloacimonadota bacterium]
MIRNVILSFSLISGSLFANNFDPNFLIEEAKKIELQKPKKSIETFVKAYYVSYPNRQTTTEIENAFQRVLGKSLNDKKYKLGLEILETALTLFPNSYPLLRFKVLYAYQQNQYDMCIFFADQIIKQLGNQNEIHYFKGSSFHKLKSYQKAIQSILKIKGTFEGKRSGYTILGDSYYHKSKLKLAIKYLKLAQKIKQSKDVNKLIDKISRELKVETNYELSTPNPHFSIKASSTMIDEAQEKLNDILEASYTDHSNQLDYYPPAPITVIVYDKEKKDFSSSLQNPNWAAGVYDGEIRIPGKELDEDPYKLETVIRHELMHLFLDSITRNSIPTWFNEGIAQYFEKPFSYDGDEAFDKREDSPLPKKFKKVLSEAIKKQKLLDMKVLNGSFMHLNDQQVLLAYAQSLMLTKYFIETFGAWKLQRLLRNLYQGNLFYVAFKKESDMTLNEFLQSWIIYQKKQWKL